MQLDTSYYYTEPSSDQPGYVEKINKANKTKTKQNVVIFGDNRDEAINYEIQNPDRDAETIKRDIRVAGDIITGTPTVAADIAYETVEAAARFVDNTFGYINKYNPTNRLYTDNFVLPDENNFYFNAGGSGKGPLRYAWDQYRALGRLLDEEPVSVDEYIERTKPVSLGGQVVSEVGQVLVPFLGAMKVVQAPQKLKQYGDVVEQMYRWTIAGFGTDFVFGDANPKEYDFLSFKPTEDILGIEDSNNRLRDILEYSFLDDDDAEIFANKLDHAFNTGIVDGMFGGVFSSLYHSYKSLYKFFGGSKRFNEKYISKAFMRQHGAKFYNFKQAYKTDAEAFAAYMKLPEVREFIKIQLRSGFLGTAPSNFNKRYDAYIKALDDQIFGKQGQVLDPLQISNPKNYGPYSDIINETRTDYTKAKNLLVDVYKRMLANKTALRLFIGGGAAYTLLQSGEAEAGVLDKSLQKIFENGGQKLYSVAKDGKLISITADDLVKMPIDKKILIKRDDEPNSWKVYEDKDEFLKSDDYFPANPIDLLPNQKYIYYDTLAQKISEMNFKEMPKEQFVNTINNMQGVKKDEIEATELLSFVSQFDGDKITKSALLQEWYPNSQIKMRTRTMGSDTGSGEMEEAYGRYEQYITPGDYDKYKEHLITFTPRKNPQIELEYEKRKLTLGIDEVDIRFVDTYGDVIKYENLDESGSADLFIGGAFKEELPLNIFLEYEGDVAVARNFPVNETEAKIKLIDEYNKKILEEIKIDFPQNFESSHFREPNILVHTRSTERQIDNTPTFFIEEVQSDWHQLGLKKGYVNDANYKLEVEDINKQLSIISDQLDQIRYAGDTASSRRGLVAKPEAELAVDSEYNKLRVQYQNLLTQRENLVAQNQGKLPDAPFKNEKDWAALGLKEMVNFAAKKGYTQIAWTSGRIQNERYNIGNYIDELQVKPANDPDYKDAYILKGIEGGTVFFNETIISQNEYRDVLEETVGKQLADKIRLAEKEAPEEFQKFGLSFTGLDLNLGSGKKMDKFYDKLIPSLLEKLYKNDGVQFYQSQLITTKEAQPAPFEEVQMEMYEEAYERVEIRELTRSELNEYNERNPDNQIIETEGYEIHGLIQDEFVVDAQLFEIIDERQIEAPLVKLYAVGMGEVPPRLEGSTEERAKEYFNDQHYDAVSEVAESAYEKYVEDFMKEQEEVGPVMRTINIMTIPESLKDRVLKLGQPLFGTNPSKLGTYEK
tara:strand:- start:4494 stop:8174 length:3681 start_codon:yes stop_codon:yes gene_type:complete